jgi:type II secretory pathway component GspD/PulD (secretin)
MKNNDAGLISTMLQQLFAARLTSMTPAGTTPAPSARVDVRFDSLSNALIVSANKENMGLIRELLKKVDIEPPVESGVVKMFPLKTADAATTTALLQSLIQQGLYKPGVAVTGANAALAAREKISIVSDFRTNTIIVSASKENLAIVEQLIKQMDIDAPWALGDIRVFILKNADCTKLGPMIQQFYTQKRASELAVNTGAKLMSVVVTADARTNALLVTGPKDAFAGIEAMVKQLDAEQVAILSDFKVFYLKQATASSIQPTLQQLFAQRVARGGVKDPVTIIADQKTNSLIVGATPDDLKVAEALITKLDSAPDSAGNKVYIFPLSKADATQVANTLKSLLQTQGGAVTGAAATPGMGISVDERMNAIVVSAGAGDVKRIEEIIKQLDTDAVANVTEIRVFTLKNADATELSTLLTLALTNKPKAMTTVSPNRQTLLQFIGRTKDGKDLITSALQEGVMITPDRRTNSLVVSAPKENMPLLESLIQAMDSTTPRMAEIKVFTLQNADAAKMALVLTQLFRLQATGGLGTTSTAVNYTLTTTQPSGDKGSSSVTVGTADQYALSVTVDGRTNSLVVGGTQHYVEMVSKIIQELDSSPTQDRMTQVYRLRNARAADVQTALRAFLDYERQRETAALGADRIGAAQRLMEQEVAVVAVNFEGAATNANTLLLAASPRYFKTVFDMIKELDQPPPQVLIQVLLAEVSLDETTDLGIDWQFSKTHHGKTTSIGTNFGAQGLLNTSGFSLSVTGSDLSMFLHALQSEGRVQVLQRPQIIAADNRQSKLIVGQRRPFVTASRITDTGQTINTIEYQDVSLTLTVTPRINPEGFVKLDIDQKIDDVNPSTTEVTPGVPAIVIDTRQAVTTVTVQDGHTIVIGGIITTKDTNQEKKVPLLGDIPLLGNLFKSTSVTKKRSELLIILTPHVVRSAADSDTTTNRQLERMNKYRDKNYRPGNELMNLIDLVSPLRSANAEWQDLLPRMSETQPTTMPLEALPELERRAATQPAIQPKDTPP